ncbi:phenylacetate--CoA ligase family protein [Candidatus Woesearchaeota archaeon]|nr:phenylacetate--CoA ligase family protein [Candidatus Woesearchaeota archaeon]
MIENFKKAIFRINYQYKNRGNNYRLYKQQLENQYKPIEQLEKIQLENLKKIVKHAYDHVPFYKRLYDNHDVKPEDIKALSDIQKLPVITKEDIRKRPLENVTAENISKNRWIEHHTSGSTNMPFLVISDKESDSTEHAAWLRELDIIGYRLGDKILKIRNQYGRRQKVMSRIFGRETFIPCSELETDTRNAMKKIIDLKPDIIETFSNTALDMARYLIHHDKKLQIKGMLVIGSPLCEEDKLIIRDTITPRVLKTYGASEVMRVAYQCDMEQGYHVDITRFVVEIIRKRKPAKEGQEGEIVITNLENYVMPFIRYRIKDSAVFTNKKCKCKRTFPLIQEIRGRLIEHTTTSSGKRIWLGLFNAILSPEVESIYRFQIVKGTGAKVIVKIQPTEKMTEDKLREIKNKIDKAFKKQLVYKIRLVEDIKPASSGKNILYKNESIYNLGGFDYNIK